MRWSPMAERFLQQNTHKLFPDSCVKHLKRPHALNNDNVVIWNKRQNEEETVTFWRAFPDILHACVCL